MFLDKRKLLKFGIGLLLSAQLWYFIAYSIDVFSSGSLSWDSALYFQPWWLISKGVLWPYSTTIGASFFGNHGELILWPLGWAGYTFRSPIFLLIIQDCAMVLTEAVTINWIYEIIFKNQSIGGFGEKYDSKINLRKIFIFASSTIILLVNPWNYWALGADFHIEPIATFFLVVSARYIYHNNSRYKYSLFLVLLCGQVATIWLVGLALSVLLAGKGVGKAAKIFIVGVGWFFVSGILGADQSNTLVQGYGYLGTSSGRSSTIGILSGAVIHFNRLTDKIISRWKDIWAYVSAPGLIGVLSPWGFGVTATILLLNVTNNYRHGVFAFPGFQGMPIGFFMAVGFADTLARFISHQKANSKGMGKYKIQVGYLVTVLMVLISIGWAIVWIPQNKSNWVKVDPSASATISLILNKIPTSDEVIVSQGIAGRFAMRRYVFPLRSLGCFPIETPTSYLVITQNEGIETLTSSQTDAVLSESIFEMGAQLIYSSNNIWLLKLSTDSKSACFSKNNTMIGSFLPSDVGIPTIGLYPRDSYMYSSYSKSGYVVYGAYSRYDPGATVDANITLSSGSGVNVEMWDDTTGTLLDRIEPNFEGMKQTVSLQGVVPAASSYRPQQANSGKFIFVAKPATGPSGDLIEIRIYTSGSAPVKVYSVRYG